MKEDPVNSNAMYMVEIENLLSVEMICLKAYFKIYFTTNYPQLQIINIFKYGKMEIHHYNRDLYHTFKVENMVYYNMQSIQ